MPNAEKPDERSKTTPEQQPYQNPGKDKNHPGDDAAVDASTEPDEGKTPKR